MCVCVCVCLCRFTRKCHVVRLPHPRRRDSKGQKSFSVSSAAMQTCNYDTECSNTILLIYIYLYIFIYIYITYIYIFYIYTYIYIYIYIYTYIYIYSFIKHVNFVADTLSNTESVILTNVWIDFMYFFYTFGYYKFWSDSSFNRQHNTFRRLDTNCCWTKLRYIKHPLLSCHTDIITTTVLLSIRN